jgi:transposase
LTSIPVPERPYQSVQSVSTPPGSPELLEMQELQARRSQLITMQVAEKNHFKSPLVSETSKKSIKSMLELIKKEIKDIDKKMSAIVEKSVLLKEKAAVIRNIKGASQGLTFQIIANLPELGILNRQKISALVGAAPFNNDSGNFNGKRQISGGRMEVRNTLYMATLTAVQWNEKVKIFYLRLLKAGKPKKLAHVAAMHKFLLIINATVKEYFNRKGTAEL